MAEPRSVQYDEVSGLNPLFAPHEVQFAPNHAPFAPTAPHVRESPATSDVPPSATQHETVFDASFSSGRAPKHRSLWLAGVLGFLAVGVAAVLLLSPETIAQFGGAATRAGAQSSTATSIHPALSAPSAPGPANESESGAPEAEPAVSPPVVAPALDPATDLAPDDAAVDHEPQKKHEWMWGPAAAQLSPAERESLSRAASGVAPSASAARPTPPPSVTRVVPEPSAPGSMSEDSLDEELDDLGLDDAPVDDDEPNDSIDRARDYGL
jgi:hypothetical protein